MPAVILNGHGVTDAPGFWAMDLGFVGGGPAGERVDGLPTFVATPTSLCDPESVVISAAVISAAVISAAVISAALHAW